MATDLIEVDPKRPGEGAIERAAAAIRRGQIVAIPTDALYTLVCDPVNLHAVGRLFAAKGREVSRSLPLLVADIPMAEDLARETSPRFYLLARRFWPGPLTIIVPSSSKVPLRVTGNTGRLAMRLPNSLIATTLLTQLNQPVVATSANLSGYPTCSSGIEVFGMLDGRVDLVLDGGLAHGSGATTVDITDPYWRVIKEGAIPEKDIADVLKGS
jgi:L-threonylcarbamoyladenylate synthase